MSGTLYVVATPIGNMGDMTERGRKVLSEVPVIACEDTRTARKLLTMLDIPLSGRRLVSYFEGNEKHRAAQLIEIIENNQDVAIISEAGTPAVSDPGAIVVREALARHMRVVPVPGVSALAAAVSVAGLADTPFVFMGFPPSKGRRRRDFMEKVASCDMAVVIYESPHRLQDTLAELSKMCKPELGILLARELTKVHEEVIRSSLGELSLRFKEEKPRGEFVLVLDPPSAGNTVALALPPLEREVARLRDLGLSAKEVSAVLAPLYGVRKAEIYTLASR